MTPQWDYIVIGTGMGGATCGYALAKAGKRVLFLEKGQSHLNASVAMRGDYAENFFPVPAVAKPIEHRDILRRSGRYAEFLQDASSAKPYQFLPFIGCGTGGSGAISGAAMERFFPDDFTPRKYHPQASDCTLPEAWPVSYSQLAPYYTQAEELYRVRQDGDPLHQETKQNKTKQNKTKHLSFPTIVCTRTRIV